MGLVSDLRTIYHLTFSRVRGGSHAERLEAFYRHQAPGYDDFRRRLLHGREELMASLDLPPGGRLLDMGGGTGANLEFLDAQRRGSLGRITIVDLCPSLLAAAQERIARNNWDNVDTELADAMKYATDGPVQGITFSYSLTMIPNWFGALERAYELLEPGGIIGVVDFYIARKWPEPGMKRHGIFWRYFWPTWFGFDNVFLSPDHLPWLLGRFEKVKLEERLGSVPYMIGLRAPYYVFVGRKPSNG
jgi:S-adenosylmethionine-diacylgycerolhomoserine-N-methlytransferase